MPIFAGEYELFINVFVGLAVLIYFVTAKDNEKRVHLVLVLAGFFALSYLFGLNFFVLQPFILGWLVLSGQIS